MGCMEKLATKDADGAVYTPVVRVELVDSEPAMWRQFELKGSMALSQVH